MEAVLDANAERDSGDAEDLMVGRIIAGDIEELQYSVDPWELRMDQLSCGRLQASFSVVQLCGILLTRAYWSRRVAATGMTPAGYVAVAGTCPGGHFNWCGSRIRPGRLVFAVDATEVDFVTPDGDDHWVMLIPVTLLVNQLGEELAADLLRIDRVLFGDPRANAELSSQVIHIIRFFCALEGCAVDPEILIRLEEQLINSTIRCLLLSQPGRADPARTTRRFHAYRQARRRLESDRGETKIEELVKLTGVSRRSLEMGFKEMLAVSPQYFARHVRLNGWRRDLLLASPELQTVTSIAEDWGFSELGRAAGYYRRLFGELPHETLRRDVAPQGARLVDALH